MTNINPRLDFVFINGKNGADKDTQAGYIIESVPNSIGLSTGDVYRSAKSEQGEYARFHPQVAPYLDLIDNHAGLLPDDVMLNIVQEIVLEKAEQGIRTFVFTGFPRTIPQLEATDTMMCKLAKVYNVNASFIGLAALDEHSLQRSEQRRNNAIARGLEPRIDDEPSMVRKRLETYRELTEPMLHKLARENRLIVVKGNGNKEELLRRTLELQDRIVRGGHLERE